MMHFVQEIADNEPKFRLVVGSLCGVLAVVGVVVISIVLSV